MMPIAGALGWTPEAFWRATPAEAAAWIEGYRTRHGSPRRPGARAPTRAEARAVAERLARAERRKGA